MKWIRTSLRFLLIAVIMASAVAAQGSATLAAGPISPRSASTILQFTSGGHALGFSSQGVYAATGKHVLKINFVGANQAPPEADSSASPSGNAAAVRVKAASLGQVSYTNLWDGINLAYSAEPGSIYSTTYRLAPGADAERIRLRYNAPLTIDGNGALTIGFESGSLTESAPIAWQEVDGQRIPVAVAYTLNDKEVGFSLGLYDRRQPLTIDPTLTWNTFLGGEAAFDDAYSIAVDANGNVYVTGDSDASWGTPVRAYTPSEIGCDGWVAKLDAADGSLIWNTFLGGGGRDLGMGIAVDGSGSVDVVGRSDANWGNPIQPYTPGSDSSGFSNDTFVAKLDTSGNLLWNTFLGHDNSGEAIAVDGNGNVYIAGLTSATWGNPILAFSAGTDAFAAKLDTSGALLWNTFLGGSGYDYGLSVAVDGSENVYVTGRSSDTWGSPVRAFTNGDDSFVAKLDPSGALLWNTFLGGAGHDEAPGVTVDGSGNVYVVGYSTATWGSPIRAYTPSYDDTYAAKLDATDGSLIWNTFLGGSGIDVGTSVALDNNGNVFITGHSNASWGNPVRPHNHSGFDGFIVKLDTSGQLQRNDFLDAYYMYGAALDNSGSAYVTGVSTKTWGNPVRPYTSGNDGFVAKLNLGVPTKAGLSPSTNSTQDGWILESSETSKTGGILNANATTIRLGDDATKKQYRAILSFSTGASLPNYATLTSVTLKLKQQAVVGGGNPLAIFKGLIVDIKNGAFGAATLQAGDFQAAASKSYGPFKPVLTGGWYSIDLTAARDSINTLATASGLTQIRLRFAQDDNNNAIANYLSLYSSNAPAANRPQLVIQYYVP